MKPEQTTSHPSRPCRETAPTNPDRRSPGGNSDLPALAGSEAAIREKALEILRAAYPQPVAADCPAGPAPDQPPPVSAPAAIIPARMMNEFVYCQRLFYYEFVEGVFVESADTLRGAAIHQRVDSGNGALPAAAKKRKAEEKASSANPGNTEGTSPQPSAEGEEGDGEPEVIHSRSVQMGSERLGIVAKMDLVESTSEKGDLLSALEVCPVDYKAGAPKAGEEGADRAGLNELWDTDKMQLGLQALILRDNGYTCTEGVIYYRATKQRVRLAITPELEHWILEQIADAKRLSAGPIPPPLVRSPKCVRCSLAPVCLPDETRLLEQPTEPPTLRSEITNPKSEIRNPKSPSAV